MSTANTRPSRIWLTLLLLAGALAPPAWASPQAGDESGGAAAGEADGAAAHSSDAARAPTHLSYASAAWAGRTLGYQPWSAQIAGGGDIVSGATGQYMHGGASAAAGVTWFPSERLPLGLRLDGSYGWFTPERRVLALGGVGYNAGTRDVYGADLDLQWDFERLSDKQKLYFLGGAGGYRLATKLQKISQAPYVCGTNFCGRYPTLLAAESDTTAWKPAVNAGVGWAMALDAHVSMFVEARYQRIFTSGATTEYFPLRVGLRF